MKVLVIPDVHLKPWIFSQAAKLMKDEAARQLYRSFGFVETGQMDGEELIAILKL